MSIEYSVEAGLQLSRPCSGNWRWLTVGYKMKKGAKKNQFLICPC